MDTLRPGGTKRPRGRRSRAIADTTDLQAALVGLRRGWPVGALAASSSGGDIAADPSAARPAQVLLPCVLCIVPLPSGIEPVTRNSHR